MYVGHRRFFMISIINGSRDNLYNFYSITLEYQLIIIKSLKWYTNWKVMSITGPKKIGPFNFLFIKKVENSLRPSYHSCVRNTVFCYTFAIPFKTFLPWAKKAPDAQRSRGVTKVFLLYGIYGFRCKIHGWIPLFFQFLMTKKWLKLYVKFGIRTHISWFCLKSSNLWSKIDVDL